MTYFSPAPLFQAPYTLRKGKTLVLKYRILIRGQELDREFLEAQWERYVKP